MKRLIDILGSVFLLVALSPLLTLTAMILLVTGERAVLYVQKRVGQHGCVFGLFKFVTMRRGSEKLPGGLLTLANDARVLPVGRLLRATKINELPQILNVLCGQMSLVGPRPQVPEHFDAFPSGLRSEILTLKPGLTGIGSIVFHDEEAVLSSAPCEAKRFYRTVIAPYKARLEIWYRDNQSLLVDVLLLLLTGVVVFWPRRLSLVWRVFPTLPEPPADLRTLVSGRAAGSHPAHST